VGEKMEKDAEKAHRDIAEMRAWAAVARHLETPG
jgi:hypothetical protein